MVLVLISKAKKSKPYAFVLSLLAAFVCEARGAVSAGRLEPTPYQSVLDSPFTNCDLVTQLEFEDFEDGLLNQVGLSTPGNVLLNAPIVITGGSDVDSIDRDFDNFGHSLQSQTHLTAFSSPPSQQFIIDFHFDASELGYVPNAFGFAWTDGAESSALQIELTTPDGVVTSLPDYQRLGDGTREASGADDVFLGFVGIDFRRVRLIGGYIGDSAGFDFFELDHLQYGRVAIPEPYGLILALSFAVVGASQRRPRT